MGNVKKSICFVIQRYGKEIVGGAESLCMQYAQELKQYFNIDVVTSCAIDYDTWENYYKEGCIVIDEIPVYRYMSVHPRHNEVIGPLTEAIYRNSKNSIRLGKKWLKEVGPLCPGIIKHIKKNKKKYDAFIFVGYHYYNSTFGLPCVPEKAIFLPTAHDEPPLRKCNYFKVLFKLPCAYIFMTEEERDFVVDFFHLQHNLSHTVVGLWVGIPMIDAAHQAETLARYDISGPYIAYAGRIDETKNCHLLFEDFAAYKQKYVGSLKLVLMGKEIIPIPQRNDIVYTGFVSEEEKLDIMGGAAAFVMPSQNESLSIVALEAMACGVPVLLNGNCKVLLRHIEKSEAGLAYMNRDNFISNLNLLLNNVEIRKKLGAKGIEYVKENYNTSIIINKMTELINMVTKA